MCDNENLPEHKAGPSLAHLRRPVSKVWPKESRKRYTALVFYLIANARLRRQGRIVGCASGASTKFYNCRACRQLREATAFPRLDQILRSWLHH